MKWYYYLNYFIYRFYDKKWGNRDNPMFRALTIPTLLVYLNAFTIWMIYEFITDFWTIPKTYPHYKIVIVAIFIFLGIVNYLILYRKKKYVKVFDEFKKNNDNYKHWNLSVKLYIILSIALFLIALIIADMRNNNFEWYFLK
jgi:MFS superfamily sulfate permease-like transporter